MEPCRDDVRRVSRPPRGQYFATAIAPDWPVRAPTGLVAGTYDELGPNDRGPAWAPLLRLLLGQRLERTVVRPDVLARRISQRGHPPGNAGSTEVSRRPMPNWRWDSAWSSLQSDRSPPGVERPTLDRVRNG